MREVMLDPRTIWYTSDSLFPVQQSAFTTSLFGVGYNMAAELDRTGSPNNEHPWRHTGGLDHCGPEVTVKRMLWIPPGTMIDVWREHGYVQSIGLSFVRHSGRFPVGTISAEFMFDDGRLFEIRSRTKHADQDWESRQIEYGDKPKGYVTVTNCVDCHEDIGKHARQLDLHRDWYTTVRGLEKGGPIHWHPWDTSAVKQQPGLGAQPKVRDSLQGIVRIVRRTR